MLSTCQVLSFKHFKDHNPFILNHSSPKQVQVHFAAEKTRLFTRSLCPRCTAGGGGGNQKSKPGSRYPKVGPCSQDTKQKQNHIRKSADKVTI